MKTWINILVAGGFIGAAVPGCGDDGASSGDDNDGPGTGGVAQGGSGGTAGDGSETGGDGGRDTETGGTGSGGDATGGEAGGGTACDALGSGGAPAEIVNGSFELPLLTTPDWIPISPGSEPEEFGWTVFQADVAVASEGWSSPVVGNVTARAFSGNQYLDLAGSSTIGGILQVLEVNSGTEYDLTFWFANNPAASSPTATVSVYGCMGTLVQEELRHTSSSPSNLAWVTFSQTFTADGPLVRVEFQTTSAVDSGGILLDAVAVTPVP